MHGHHKQKRRRYSTVARCGCGRELTDQENYECAACRRSWQRAQRAPGFLPTVDLFPELAPEKAPEPAPAPDLFSQPTEG